MSANEKMNFDRDFENLYKDYFLYLVNYLSAMVHDFTIAEDITHDVFLRIYKNRKVPPSDRQKCRSYMMRSAKNMAIDHLRRQKRDELKIQKLIPEWDGSIDQSFDVENIHIEGSIISTVHDVLSDFPERNRTIFFESVIENKKLNDISSRGKLSRYKVKKIEKEIFCRLKQKLKEYLE